ncbi:MAG TPA: RIP metalloprotease RseP [Casimicrobiaceae bacterium]|jgi:regulator of sigma E protease|nr:RIP metalloprotease RseP [Casimicrobiaceae bacterium]
MIGIAQKVLAFAVTLGVLITFHELGHYLIARLVGVKVLRFSIGFGRVIWSRRVGRDGTEWALSVLPLGGYVKMVDEREGEVAPSDLPRAFNRQSVWKRAAIVVAGPLANLLLAVLLFTGTYVVGVPGQRAVLATPPAATPAAAAGLAAGEIVRAVDDTAVRSWQDLRWHLLRASGQDDATLTVERPDGTHATRKLALGSLRSSDWEGDFLAALGLRIDLGAPRVNEVLPDKPAAAAGLRAGDTIVAVDGVPMRSPADVATTTNAHPGERLRFTLRREGATSDIEVVPEATEQDGRRIGIAGMRLGVDPSAVASLAVTVRYGPVEALLQGASKTWDLSVFTLQMLGRILSGSASLKNISGPLTMADYAGQSAQAGALTFIGYLALISISLGVLNLLPVPILDGGHLLYYLVEVFKGSPVSDRVLEVGQRIGMAVLALLMALALFNDLTRFF